MSSVPTDLAHFSIVTPTGEVVNMAPPAIDDIPPPLPASLQIVMTLKAGSPSLTSLLGKGTCLPCPINVTLPRSKRKSKRYARGGLRPMVAQRTLRYVAHGMTMQGDNSGMPWTIKMRVTKRTAKSVPC